MRFCDPATLVKDDQYRGPDVLPVDVTRSGRLGRSERMSLEEPIPELRKPVSPPDPRHRESKPPSHDFR